MIKYLRSISIVIFILFFISCNRTQEPFSFVQLCDPQLGMGGYEHDMETLKQAVEQINLLEVDFAVICGDLVNHANDSSYNDFKTIIEEFDIPYYLVPGNHDVGFVPNDTTLAFYRSTLGEDYFSFRHKGISFIFTNSQLWKTDIGEESHTHDSWFKETLINKKSDEQAIVIGHIPIYIKDIFEEETYSNFPPEKRTDLLSLLEDNNVVAYLSGHKHEVVINNYRGIQLLTGETTSKSFDESPMGFRKWDVNSDTVIHSFVGLEAQQAGDIILQTTN